MNDQTTESQTTTPKKLTATRVGRIRRQTKVASLKPVKSLTKMASLRPLKRQSATK